CADELLAEFHQFNVVCSRDRFTRTDTDDDAWVVFVGRVLHPLSVPRIGFGTGQRTARVDGRGFGEFGRGKLDHSSACGRQAGESGPEAVGDRWRQVDWNTVLGTARRRPRRLAGVGTSLASAART